MQITFTVNGKEKTLTAPPDRRLVDILREDLGLKGTKMGCGEGECGACTVILDGVTVNSCLVPACQIQGKSVITIEGLVESGEIGEIEECFLEEGAVQCGYCTPGLVVSTFQLLRKNPNPSASEIKEALSGNLCRCTGYIKVITAVTRAADKRKAVRSR